MLALALLMAVSAALGACSGSAPSFDPAGPCIVDGKIVDGRAQGAYPELEAVVPRAYDGKPASRLDSGRNCSEKNLTTLRARGLASVRFAGGLWEVGNRSGVTLAIFTAPGLTNTMLFEWYETGARTASKTDAIQASDAAIGGIAARRLDLLNDESYQTVITWPVAEGTIRVILVGSDVRETVTRAAHDERVAKAIAASTDPANTPSAPPAPGSSAGASPASTPAASAR